MKRTIPAVFVAALFVGLGTSAIAEDAAGQAATHSNVEKMKSWDPDNDGTIDLAEANIAAAAKFDSLEGDNDGTLDRKELASTKIDKKTFTRADPDKDGTLTKVEYLTIVESQFKAADPDSDGTVSVAELQTKAGKALARLLK